MRFVLAVGVFLAVCGCGGGGGGGTPVTQNRSAAMYGHWVGSCWDSLHGNVESGTCSADVTGDNYDLGISGPSFARGFTANAQIDPSAHIINSTAYIQTSTQTLHMDGTGGNVVITSEGHLAANLYFGNATVAIDLKRN